jgi:hypothetical protein
MARLLRVSLVLVAVAACGCASQIRMRWQDFSSGPGGAKRVARLQAAVQKMKSLDSSPKSSADYRRSWEYWANIHGYYGAQSPDGTLAQQIQWLQANGMGSDVSYYSGMTDQTAPDAAAQATWATCQHSGGPGQQALNFFGWHRMYLYYFERVLRWAAHDKNLRLPYWDYTNPSQVTLPAPYRAVPSVLYDAKRDPDMNTATASLNPDSTNVNPLLPLTDYFDYESQIEEGVHGYVHCTVGPTCPVAHMGDVPVAGNDPIFYSHHANIDRLWACWQHLHPTPPGTWQDQTFSFVDETGALQTKAVKGFLITAALGYAYDNVSNCSRPTPLAMLAPAPVALKQPTAIGAASNVAIKGPLTSVDLEVPAQQLKDALGDLQHAGAVELVLRDVTADSHPGVLFDVFLAKRGDLATRQLVGTLSWFSAFHHHGSPGPSKRTLHYDVTEKLRALGGDALAASGLSVVIEATRGRRFADAAKTEDERQRAGKEFRTESNLQIGAIELRGLATPPKPQ